ncbi:MAG: hypothetical protein QOE34_1911 [Verrucomicrobiota bacterium]|jgi:hypothetical protein
MAPIASPKFADIQNMLDAIAAADTGNPLSNAPHNTSDGSPFWRQTGKADADYQAFTTGGVPNFGDPIMDPNAPLNSLFYLMLLGTGPGPQMPLGGPYITDANYSVSVNGTNMTGQDINTSIQSWLTNGFPQ